MPCISTEAACLCGVLPCWPPPPPLFSSESEKLEKDEDEARNRTAFSDMGTPELRVLMMGLGGNLGNMDGRAVVIINAQGIVQVANNGCEPMFGFTKAELRGKNVALLIPEPTASLHQGYLRAYITTGRERMMNRTTYQLALHRLGHLVPIYATLAKVSGVGEDTVIMGVIERVVPDEGCATLWVGLQGDVMSCDTIVTDWLAYAHADLAGTPMLNLVVSGAGELERALQSARASVLLAEYNHHKKDVVRMAKAEALLPTSKSVGGAARTRSALPLPQVPTVFPQGCEGEEEEEGEVQPRHAAANHLLWGPSKAINQLLDLAQDAGQTEWVVPNVVVAHKYGVSVFVRVYV